MSFFSVNTNLPSLIAQTAATNAGAGLQRTLNRLSTGLRINSGGDDPAGLAIADGLRGQIRTLQQSLRNVGDGTGLLQTADGALNQVSNLLTRLATILSEGASDNNFAQLPQIQNELQQIQAEITRIGSATNFNGTDVFSASSYSIFVGDTHNVGSGNDVITFTTNVLSAASLGLTTTTLLTTADAQTALGQVQAAIDQVATTRGLLGAATNRLTNAAGVIQAQIQNLSAAESQIRDANIAEEVANLTKFQILTQTGIASLAQANQTSQSVLALFQ